MKHLFFILVTLVATFIFATSSYAQDDIYFSKSEKQQQNSSKEYALKKKLKQAQSNLSYSDVLNLSGAYLQKSSTFDYCAIGSALAGGVLAGVGAGQDDIDSARPLYYAGAVLGVAALVFRAVAISYKSKSGKILQLAPSGLTYNF